MILARADNQLFTVHVDHHDLDRLSILWKLADRIEELHYSTKLRLLPSFLSSFGPAPNLKVIHLRPELTVGIEEPTPLINLPVIFSGCLPSLRDLSLTNTVTWPTGLFRGLVSFECGTLDHYPISPVHVLDVLRESPSLEYIRLVGYCETSEGFHPPTVALLSLEKCTLIGRGTTSLIRFLTIPAPALVFLSRPYIDDGMVFPKFDDISAAPGLRILDGVSAVSFFITDYAVRLQVKNDRGGVLEVEVDELYDLSRDPIIFGYFIRSSFQCGRTCPGFKTTKEFTLGIERGRIWEPEEETCLGLDVMVFIFEFPSIEEVKLHGVPPLELSSILEFLHNAAKSEPSCPNLKRLYIESIPLHSPRSLLAELSKLLVERKEAGVPLHSVTVKVKCERLIPTADHRAFLTDWEGIVEGGVRLEYEKTKVKKLPRCRRRNYEDEDECGSEGDEWDSGDEDEDWDGDEDGEDEDEGEDGRVAPADPDDVGWGGWPEEWPATVEEMKGR